MAFNFPSIADFKARFNRDFPYGNADLTTVQDNDITVAMQDALAFCNQGLFADQNAFNLGFLLLSAHYLVMNLRASTQGLNGNYPFLLQSKGVGSVSSSAAISQRLLDNPIFADFSKTNYGHKYLMLILPNLTGAMFTVCRSTEP